MIDMAKFDTARSSNLRRFGALAIVAAMVGALVAPTAVMAQSSSGKAKSKAQTERRGGYSYSAGDTVNTYGDSRGQYGRSDSLRDPSIDRQTNFGPFDHGYFFDSGVGPRGGNSPYLN
jgi:uncharacterized membrane protein